MRRLDGVSRLSAVVLLVLAWPCLADSTAFIGGTVIDGTGALPLADAVMVVQGERITALGPRAEVAIPDEAVRVDVAGRWIIPGLIDAHVHFYQSGGLYTRPDSIDLREVRPYAKERAANEAKLPETLARYLASGVTSVVDVGGPLWNFEVRALAERTAMAPRVAVAGPLLATFAPTELDGPDQAIIRIETPRHGRKCAASSGIDPIWSRFGSWTPRRISDRILPGCARRSRRAMAPVCPSRSTATQLRVARAVVAAGADILVHRIDDVRIDDAMLELLRRRGVVYTPTLLVPRRYRAVYGRHLALIPIERRLGDPEAIASFDDLDRLPARLVRHRTHRSEPRPLRPIVTGNLVRVAAAGITVAAGSDAGNIGTLHGPSLHRELELMVEAGMTPMAVLTAATAGGAAVMGRADDLGSLVPGKLADFLILEADPLTDIRHTQRIAKVVKGGEVFDPGAIEAALAQR